MTPIQVLSLFVVVKIVKTLLTNQNYFAAVGPFVSHFRRWKYWTPVFSFPQQRYKL